MRVLLLVIVALTLAAAPMSGRDAEQAPTPAAPATPSAPAVDPGPTPPPNYEYAADSRRDPFISLVSRGETRGARTGQVRPEGLTGIMVDELVVRGILQARGAWVAMIGAPSGRTYTVRAGDRLMDGSVRLITAQSVVLHQDVNDPLSLEKQREVRKSLHGDSK